MRLTARRWRWVGLLFLPLVAFWFVQLSWVSPETKSAENPSELDAGLFRGTKVLRIQIEIPPEGADKLRRYHWQGWSRGQTQKRENVKAIVREGGKVYRDVAVHLKGAAGSFRPFDDRPALTLNFDKFVKDQTFHGLEKFSLNNSVQDPSYLNEKICRELFAAAGIPVPRADHAIVELNGRNLGLYVLTEGFNKQFLRRHFSSDQGTLYDGGFVQDVNSNLAVNVGDDATDRADLKALEAAARERDPIKLWNRLHEVLDVDRFVTMMAMEVIQCHWDGYAMNVNNYRVYHDPESDKMVFIPHGLDQMFGVERASPSMPIFPPMRGLVARAVLQTPEGRRLYVERISSLVKETLDVELVTKGVKELGAKIRPIIVERSSRAASQHDRQVADFCERIARRAASLKEQLAQVEAELEFDGEGKAKLTDWRSKPSFGKPSFDKNVKMDGRTALQVSVERGSSVGSWQTQILLAGGRYRLEGQIKTRRVSPDPGDRRGGAGFRVQNSRQLLSGTTDWQTVRLDFEVRNGMEEVEVFCELRAAEGEAWFDPESIVLMRR